MKKCNFILLAAVMVASLLLLSSCTTEQKTENNGKIKVMATLFPQYDFIRQIAGDKCEVELLVPLGVESHGYDPTFSDIKKIQNTDLFVYTGDEMEPWVKKLISAQKNKTVILDVSKGISLKKIPEHDEEPVSDKKEEHEHETDPHIWTSVKNAEIMTQNITDTLCEIDSKNAEYYRKNAEAYTEKLKELDNKFRETVDNGRIKELFFGGRFAFYYFVNDYGLDYEAAYDSCSEDTEPSLKKLSEMTADVKAQNAKVILYEELSDPKVAKSLAGGTDAKIKLFHSCHNLSKLEFKQGKTYLSLMYENVKVLKEALQ